MGESGSGKTLLSRSILQLLPAGITVAGGSILFNGQDLLQLDKTAIQRIRGNSVGMVFQEPLTSLNPALKIGYQLAEGLRLHTSLDQRAIGQRCIEMLEQVRIKTPKAALNQYPHEFSGGMRQRIMLASTLLLKPALLIADEPTTALDVIIQKEVMEITVALARQFDVAVLIITHDLSLVAEYANRVAVMDRGVIVEQGYVKDVLSEPKHAYTKKLLNALPGKHHVQIAGTENTLKNTDSDYVVKARNLQLQFVQKKLFFQKTKVTTALNNVSINIKQAETVAVVGESGSGKTTLGRALLGLTAVQSGEIFFKGNDISNADKKTWRSLRENMQLIFQDPFSSLDPRMSVRQLVAEAISSTQTLSKAHKDNLAHDILQEVGLPKECITRYPHELSGGQRQRVAIARAIIRRPEFVVADEPVSALDVTVQLQILKLLKQMQHKFNFSCLFISHDLAVVEQVADRILVMYHGNIVEQGPRNAIFSQPRHPYTIALLNAMPQLEKAENQSFSLSERALSTAAAPSGYSYDGWDKTSAMHSSMRLVEVGSEHFVACRAVC